MSIQSNPGVAKLEDSILMVYDSNYVSQPGAVAGGYRVLQINDLQTITGGNLNVSSSPPAGNTSVTGVDFSIIEGQLSGISGSLATLNINTSKSNSNGNFIDSSGTMYLTNLARTIHPLSPFFRKSV